MQQATYILLCSYMDQADNSEIIEGSTPTKTSTRKSRRMQESLKNIKMARREISLGFRLMSVTPAEYPNENK